jgi:SAM-dependent methyltransferase
MALPKNCPLCKSGLSDQSVITSHVYGQGKKRESSFFQCQSCDIIYQYPRLNEKEESHFYAKEFEQFMESRAGENSGWKKATTHVTNNEDTRLRRMNYILPHLNDNARLLEVGCSSGFMLYPLEKMGNYCVGIEPSGVFSDFVKNNNLTIFNSIEHLLENKPKIKFDLIMHFFVLEHISDPLSFLLDQLDLLEPNGKIIFEIPNAADPLYSVYDIESFERFYWSMAHHWYFNYKSLKFLLDKLGYRFEIQLEQRYDLSNHMVWAKDGRPGGMGKFSDFLGKELEESYKKNLIKSGHCDTLIGIVYKGS